MGVRRLVVANGPNIFQMLLVGITCGVASQCLNYCTTGPHKFPCSACSSTVIPKKKPKEKKNAQSIHTAAFSIQRRLKKEEIYTDSDSPI